MNRQRAAECINTRLDELGLTQQALADATNLSVGTISRIRHAATATSPQTLARVSEALGWTPTSLADMLAGTEHEPIIQIPDLMTTNIAELTRRIAVYAHASKQLILGKLQISGGPRQRFDADGYRTLATWLRVLSEWAEEEANRLQPP